ncbi:MAG: hypothetical protein ACRD3J_14325 [Thermoanaerobaculia bacterium]
MQAQVTTRPKRSAVRTAAKVYFAPWIALLALMSGMFVLGLTIFGLQLLAALLKYLHL